MNLWPSIRNSVKRYHFPIRRSVKEVNAYLDGSMNAKSRNDKTNDTFKQNAFVQMIIFRILNILCCICHNHHCWKYLKTKQKENNKDFSFYHNNLLNKRLHRTRCQFWGCNSRRKSVSASLAWLAAPCWRIVLWLVHKGPFATMSCLEQVSCYLVLRRRLSVAD